MTLRSVLSAAVFGAAVLAAGCGGSDDKTVVPKDLNQPLPEGEAGSGGKKPAAPSGPKGSAD